MKHYKPKILLLLCLNLMKMQMTFASEGSAVGDSVLDSTLSEIATVLFAVGLAVAIFKMIQIGIMLVTKARWFTCRCKKRFDTVGHWSCYMCMFPSYW